MTKGEKIRAAGIILSIILLFLFISGLNSNTHKKFTKIETEEFALVNAQTLAAAFNNVPNDTTGQIQSLLENMQNNHKSIVSASIVDGKKFAAHSNNSLIGERIPKDIFDAQWTLQKNFKEDQQNTISKEWTEEDDVTSLLVTVSIIQNGKFIGIVGLKALPRKLDTLASPIILWILAVISIIILIIIDKFLPKKIKIPVGIIILIITIGISISLIIGGGANPYANQWEKEKGSLVVSNHKLLHKNSIPIELEIFASQINIKTNETTLINIKNWQSLDVSQDVLTNKYASNKRAGSFTTIALSIFGCILLVLIFLNLWEKFVITIQEFHLAYLYILPAMLGVFLLVFFPFIYGFLIGFTDYGINDFSMPLLEYFTNLGRYNFGNFVKILSDFNISDYQNFYFTLFHNIIWTILNVVLHVSIGVFLALLLNNPKLKGRTFYRIILILPWAIPNYITALIWRGMFHKQFGAVNGLLNLLGFESISWFLHPITSFLANLATNVWLGFPFMMVIALGALQSIPKELYEAANIDGASRWQGFWNVTFPLLKPAMIPSTILGVIWTFNQFNIIYLVSGGAPDGATEILITDAYRYAFEQYRYGYAAAYSIIIFFILMAFGIYTSKISKATEGVYE